MEEHGGDGAKALTIDDFGERIGATFTAALDNGTVPLILDECTPLARGGRDGAFRLSFRGPAQPMLEQAIHRFATGDDSFEIFIVPVAQAGDGTITYEAIFN